MQRIIIFDGLCGLCNKSIDLLIKLDKYKVLQYTSLQGKFVKALNIEADIDSVIFYEDDTIYYRSTAILKILRSLGGGWIFVNIFYLIPRFLRDAIYDIIAKYHYIIFGKMESCRMLKEGEEKLFLD